MGAGTRPGSGHRPHVAMASWGSLLTMEGERRRGWGEPWVQNTRPGAWQEVESGLYCAVTPTLGLCHDMLIIIYCIGLKTV